MGNPQRLEPYKQLIAALLCDVQTSHSEVFTTRSLRLTTAKVMSRLDREGMSFLTKTLPRLGKALDRALTGEVPLDAATLRFSSLPGSKLPKLFGELFERIFSHDGWILPTPCVRSIKTIRQLLFVFYKLKLPYTPDLEQQVVSKFIETEKKLEGWNSSLSAIADWLDAYPNSTFFPTSTDVGKRFYRIARRARNLISQVFANFDVMDIHPRHGPGAVSTKEKLWFKYTFREISPRILDTYPLDAYFYASNGHVCDELARGNSIKLRENSARVLLVPKDSRGPRLISCEPLDFQWIQQGLGRAIVQHLEEHPLTRYSVHFTDQQPNQIGALWGSTDGRYATLDLNEASDRISIGLVRLLFTGPLRSALLNCRSQTTVLPSGQRLTLNKYAPMGSALCFPVLATCIWALLAAGLPDAGTAQYCFNCTKCSSYNCERILVYGDDVVVPAAKAANAISILESFGLVINRDKSCSSGFFRESCGVDAYRGENVTPVRIRTVWSNHRCPDAYESYIAYANAFYKQRYYRTHETIVTLLTSLYGEIPDVDMNLSCPSLIGVPDTHRPKVRRVNKSLQKLEWRVLDIKTPTIRQEIDGWKMLLRYFAENSSDCPLSSSVPSGPEGPRNGFGKPSSVSSYTKRSTSYLVKRWR